MSDAAAGLREHGAFLSKSLSARCLSPSTVSSPVVSRGVAARAAHQFRGSCRSALTPTEVRSHVSDQSGVRVQTPVRQTDRRRAGLAGVEVFWDAGGFIARVRLRDDPVGHERTLMVSRDVDVAHLVDGPLRAELKSLTFLRSSGNGQPTQYVAEDVREIHRGTDACSGGEVILFRGTSGGTFRIDGTVTDASSVVNPRLLARIGD